MRVAKWILLTVIAVAAGGPARAAIVTLTGTDVDFLIDDAQPGLALYGGMPTVAGDSLLFFPTTFRAQSTDGAGTATANATVSFEIRAHGPTLALGDVGVTETGDYFVTPGSGGSTSVVAQLGATNLTAANPPASFRQDIETTGTLTAGGASGWSLATGLDFTQLWFNASQRARVDIQNTLTAASSGSPSTAWIEKKFEGMIVDVQVVPLPASLPLLLSGVAALGAAVRRRRTAA